MHTVCVRESVSEWVCAHVKRHISAGLCSRSCASVIGTCWLCSFLAVLTWNSDLLPRVTHNRKLVTKQAFCLFGGFHTRHVTMKHRKRIRMVNASCSIFLRAWTQKFRDNSGLERNAPFCKVRRLQRQLASFGITTMCLDWLLLNWVKKVQPTMLALHL